MAGQLILFIGYLKYSRFSGLLTIIRYKLMLPSSIAETRIALSEAFSTTISGHNFVLSTSLKFPCVLATAERECKLCQKNWRMLGYDDPYSNLGYIATYVFIYLILNETFLLHLVYNDHSVSMLLFLFLTMSEFLYKTQTDDS